MVDVRPINTICPNCFASLDKLGLCLRCGVRASNQSDDVALLKRTLLKNRYLIGKTLGFGGFGITYLAYDMLTSSKIAIKEFFPKGYTKRLNANGEVGVTKPVYTTEFNHWKKAFILEAETLARIKKMHGVVKLLDFFQANNTAYIAMDYLEGVSLRQHLNNRGGKIPLKEALNIMRPVMDSLFLLHQYGLIHKDISPENILIMNNNCVKLIDFGAASFFNESVSKPYIVLKSGFSPIELYKVGMKQGPFSDIYQTAATIYNSITGIILPEATMRQQNDMLLKPSAFGVQIPLIVENSLMRALSIDPKARYDNFGSFIQILYGEFLPRF